jgi:hypothetical protein
MPLIADWPTTGSGKTSFPAMTAQDDVIELPILLPEWQVNALETAARERNMTIGQFLRRHFADVFADRRP